MAYKNQNYMTNAALKEQADQAQKDYKKEEVPTFADVSVIAKNSTNELIADCTVTLTKGNDSFVGTTDNKGECTIKDVLFGEYEVLASAGNYLDVTQILTVKEGTNNLEIIFTEQQFGIEGPTFEETEEDFF